jgi:hypothetical protein
MLFDQGEHFSDCQGLVNLIALAGQLFGERVRRNRREQDQGHAADFFLRSAQRFFIASPIRLRAAADKCRLRLRPSGLPAAVIPRPRWPPCNAAMALLRRSRSASNSAMIDCVSKGVLLVFRMATILQETPLQDSGSHFKT